MLRIGVALILVWTACMVVLFGTKELEKLIEFIDRLALENGYE